MQILYFDTHATRPNDSFRLILLHSGWHVVAKGYLCRVHDEEEGRRVITAFQVDWKPDDLHIDKP
jgi:hypothetical protein